MGGHPKNRVLVAGIMLQEGLKVLQGEYEVVLLDKRADLPGAIKEVDALVVCDDTKVDGKAIHAGTSLQLIAKVGANLEGIDVEQATAQGITVLHVPERSVISMAEHTMAVMLLLARKLPQAISSLKKGDPQRDKYIGVELHGKTLGIIGLGRSGSEVAKRARSFGMQVCAYDPYISAGHVEKLGISFVPWDTVLQESDFITIHVPRSASTMGMIGREELQRMKRGVCLVNSSHAGLVDEQSLYEAVKEGQVAGAALDATVNTVPGENPLLGLEEVFITPELSSTSREAEVEAVRQATLQVIQALRGEPVATAVNAPSLAPEFFVHVKPFIPLMETMGSFYMQVFGGRIKVIEIIYSGKIAGYPLQSLTTALLTGLFRIILGKSVNYVNASLIAEQRGIRVTEVSSKSSSNFSNLVTMHVQTEEGRHTLAGTLFEDNIMRLVQIGEYRLEVAPSRYMLVTRHIDKPGVVGKIGTILGDTSIASMRLGRSRIGGEAVMVLQVDKPVQEEVLEAISRLEPILKASFVQL